jgi:hypothetical protein
METESRWSEDMVIVAEEVEKKTSFLQDHKGTIVASLLTAAASVTATLFVAKWVENRNKKKFYRSISDLLDKIESANNKMAEIPNEHGELEDVTGYTTPTTRELIYVIQTKLKVETSETEREVLVQLLDRVVRVSQNVMKNEVATAKPRKQ